jgi:hypothetical protein
MGEVWPLPAADVLLLEAAYDRLTVLGNGTAVGGVWDPLLDRAHQAMGLLLGRHQARGGFLVADMGVRVASGPAIAAAYPGAPAEQVGALVAALHRSVPIVREVPSRWPHAVQVFDAVLLQRGAGPIGWVDVDAVRQGLGGGPAWLALVLDSLHLLWRPDDGVGLG